MKLVTNGEEYGIRKGFWPFYSYVDLQNVDLSWMACSCMIRYCFDPDRERVIIIMKSLDRPKNITVVKD